MPLLALCLTACAGPSARATGPAAYYYGQTLLAQAAQGGALCQLWLFTDGRYAALHTLSPANSEVREGSYGSSEAPGGTQLCLRPDTDDRPAAPRLLFLDPGCLVLPTHPIGEAFTLTYRGLAYRLVLMQRR